MHDTPDFETLLHPVLDTAYRMAYRMTGTRDEAMDLVQDATIQAFRRFETFSPESNFRAWFLRIMTNRFLKERPKKARAGQSVQIEDVEDVFLYQKTKESGLYETSTDPATLLMDRLDAEAVQLAIDHLPDDFRTTISLYFLDDMPYDEIARTMDVPIGTVRSRIHRGRKMLQKELWNLAEARGLVPTVTESSAKEENLV
ncbi:MAG: sigma-70 family RNA polymerase sigma factor [Fimbriimonas sp.]